MSDIFLNSYTLGDQYPLIVIKDRDRKINFHFVSPFHPKYEKKEDTPRDIYISQGIPLSETVYKVKEFINHYVFKNKIVPEDIYLWGEALCKDGEKRFIPFGSELIEDNGANFYLDEVEPEMLTMNITPNKLKELNEIKNKKNNDITHFPLYNLRPVIKNNTLTIFMSTRDNFPQNHKNLLETLFLQQRGRNITNKDSDEIKSYNESQEELLKNYGEALNKHYKRIFTTNIECNWETYSINNIVAHWGKRVNTGNQSDNSISFKDLFESFPEEIMINGRPFKFIYRHYK